MIRYRDLGSHRTTVSCFLVALILFAFSAVPSAPSASERIRVLIMNKQRHVTLHSPTGLTAQGISLGKGRNTMALDGRSLGAPLIRVRANAEDFIRVNGKRYRGWVEIRRQARGLLLVINELDIEEYLRGVVASEIPHDWEYEALKAQAVASRTYAVYTKRQAGRRPYHILATVKNQIYGGVLGERERTVRAVNETRGLVLTYEGDVIPAFYHSSCGGHTENASELWGIDEPYLKGVDCDCQEISKYGVWEKRFSLTAVSNALGRKGYQVKGMRSLNIESITPAGRVRDVAIGYAGGTTTIPAEEFRTAIGYALLPSVFFETAVNGNEVVLSGRGFGHGVGMCQWGAREMAQRGKDFLSILERYYPGTRVTGIDNR